jgi:hypothetical protein
VCSIYDYHNNFVAITQTSKSIKEPFENTDILKNVRSFAAENESSGWNIGKNENYFQYQTGIAQWRGNTTSCGG